MNSRVERLLPELKEQGITHPAVLEALSQVPREVFIPKPYQSSAYDNTALPIGHKQTISQPYIVGLMTQYLLLPPFPHKILEIGTGSGYQTAILATIFDEIWTIERINALCKRAKTTLQKLNFNNIHFQCSDGTQGWPEAAPFDAIIVTAATEQAPESLLNQLSPQGGTLLIPLGSQNKIQYLTLIKRQENKFHTTPLEGVIFVPLIANK